MPDLYEKIRENAVGIVSAMALMAGSDVAANPYIPPVTIPEQMLGDLQIDLHLKEFQAAGILGNLAQETGNFQFLKEMNPLIEGSDGGLGYAQWTASRRIDFLIYAETQDVMSYDVNYGFLLSELRGPYYEVLKDLRKTTSLEDATKLFMDDFLKPSKRHAQLERRLDFAQNYMDGDFSGAGCLSDFEVIKKWGKTAIAECEKSLAEIRPEIRPDDLMQEFPEYITVASVRPQSRPVAVDMHEPKIIEAAFTKDQELTDRALSWLSDDGRFVLERMLEDLEYFNADLENDPTYDEGPSM